MIPGTYTRTEETREKQRVAALERKAQGRQPRGWKWTETQREILTALSKARTGSKNHFFGKHHSEESKVKACQTKTGVSRNAEERAQHREKYKKQWRDEHPEKIKEYDMTALRPRAIANSKRRHSLRLTVIAKLGGRCASPDCRWMNKDGSIGCTDIRVLHIDHIDGGGTQERNRMHVEGMWKKVLASEYGYQLLCSNCNWIKAHENGEFKVKYKMEER